MFVSNMLPVDINERKKFVVYVDFDGKILKFRVIDTDNEVLVSHACYPLEMIQSCLDDVLDNFSHYKAVVCNVFGLKTPQCPINLAVCNRIKKKLLIMKVPTYFLSINDISATALLVAAKVDVNIGENVLVVFATATYNVNVCRLVRYQDGYYYAGTYCVVIDEHQDIRAIHSQIVGNSRPRSILVYSDPFNRVTRLLQTVYLPEAQFYFGNACMDNAVVEISKWMLNEHITRYHIEQVCVRKYNIMHHSVDGPSCKLFIDVDEALPRERKCVIEDTSGTFYLAFVDDMDNVKAIEPVLFDENYQKHELTLMVDYQNFPSYSTKPFVQCFATRLDTLMLTKMPVVAFIKDKSILMVFENVKYGYDYHCSWNGFNGRNLCISFDEKNPKYFEDALKVMNTSPSNVVYDLLKIMSMSSDDVTIDSAWSFSIIRTEENPVLLEFDDYDGTKKSATPIFLMAMLLKQHLKALEKTNGQRPSRIGYCFLDTFEDDAAMNRAIDGIKAACDLLKVESEFVYV